MDRLEDVPVRRATLVVALLAFFLGLSVFWPMLPGDPRLMADCACGDPAQQSWFLGYFPWSLFHGHNPFITNFVDFPRGVNLAASTYMPLLGVLFYPLTLLAGATTTYSLLAWLAYPLSTVSCFYVMRRLTGSNIASTFAGLVYGFSPYAIHQGYGHLNLSFVPLPPLILYFVHVALESRTDRAWRHGLRIGGLATAQFLISSEVAVTTAVVGVIYAMAWLIGHHDELSLRRLGFFARVVSCGSGLALVILAVPVWYQLFGVAHVIAPAQGGIANPFRADLLGAVVPTRVSLVGPTSLKAVGDLFTNANVSENGAYLGLPLVALFLGCLWRYRRQRSIQVTGLVTLLCWVLSLGPELTVDGKLSSIRLPFALLARVPQLDNILPARLTLFVIFFAGWTVAQGVSTWVGDVRRQTTPRAATSKGTRWSGVAIGAALLLPLLALAPRVPLPTQAPAAVTPAYFSLRAALDIPRGSVVLTYPYIYPTVDEALVWQTSTRFRWRVMGGYFTIPYPNARIDGANPWPTPPTDVVDYLIALETGHAPVNSGPSSPPPHVTPRLLVQTRRFVRRYGVRTVVVSLVAPNAPRAVSLFTAAFGEPRIGDGAAVWSPLASRSR